jgi:hypothetical protein
VTEPDRTDERSPAPLPGPLPGLTFDDVTGRVIRTEVPPEEPAPVSPSSPAPPSPLVPSSPASSSSVEPEVRVPDRGVSREQQRTEGRAMVPLLARALATQLEQVAGDPAPEGWWFTPDR